MPICEYVHKIVSRLRAEIIIDLFNKQFDTHLSFIYDHKVKYDFINYTEKNLDDFFNVKFYRKLIKTKKKF